MNILANAKGMIIRFSRPRRVARFIAFVIIAFGLYSEMPFAEASQGKIAASVRDIVISESKASTTTRTAAVTINIRNIGTSPVILVYIMGSASLRDDTGRGYGFDRNHGNEGRHVKGIGTLIKNQRKIDPQFQLSPGESRDMVYEGVTRYHKKKGQVAGSTFDLRLKLRSYSSDLRAADDELLEFHGLPSRMSR